MRKLYLFLTLPTLVGCGDGKEGNAPSISNLDYSPTTAAVGDFPVVSGTFDFSDVDADAELLGVAVDTPSGQHGAAPPEPAQGVNGQETGTVFFAFQLDTSSAGSYDFELWLIDEQGNASNRLVGLVYAQ